ncbi:hypothetical protein POTOM_002818 [Populus tomentosa]|uniref:ABC-type xenobiotic transporter n=1 Tax=Populus tomentosa TaxID=118781 RepID=A0A8X8DKJ9_POPTO|nr:hypothetical protein POTOM_002818 [Populus tomentosa]
MQLFDSTKLGLFSSLSNSSSLMYSGASFLLKPIFVRGFSGSLHLVLLLALVVSYVWKKLMRGDGGEGSGERFRNNKRFLCSKQTLLCCLGVSVFNIFLCLLSYFYWYKNGWCDVKLVNLFDSVLRTLSWGALSVYLYTLNSDFLFYHKHESSEVRYLVSDIVSVFTALFLCYVGFLRHETQDSLLEQPFLNVDISSDTSNTPTLESNKSRGGDAVTTYANAGPFSILTFYWMNSLIALGNKKTLDLEDVPQLDSLDSVFRGFPAFRNKLESHNGAASRVTPFKLAKALFLSTWKEILWIALLAIIYTSASYVGPYLIDAFVQCLDGRGEYKNQGYILALTFFVTKLVECISQRHWFFRLQQIGLRHRAVTTTMIYNKGLTLSNQSKQGQISGEIINIMTVDADRIGEFSWYMHDPWLILLQVGLALLILYQNLGLASVAAFVATIVVMLIHYPLGRLQKTFQDKLMDSKDKRMRATTEILRNMRILKLQGWEMKFLSKILELRDVETGWLKKYVYNSAMIMSVFWLAPTLMAVATFGACMLIGIPLESGKILSALATFRVLQMPIYSLPDTLSMTVQTKISGTLKLCGTKAYVAQSTWIQSGKIEENILFGKEMDRERYERILEACSLKKDLEIMSFGDQTIIGERGINLSGGQKQRIQIARALYQDVDIYLFDDPFSVVDAHTRSHLFKEVLLGLLSSKTVIYVTHQVEFLLAADLILVMKDGRIAQAGKYDEILCLGSDFMELIGAHEAALTVLDSKQKGPASDTDVIMQKQGKNDYENCKSDKVAEPKAQIIQEEERETGSVGFPIYWNYITTAYGGGLVPFILLAQILFQVLQISSNYWMAWAAPVSKDVKPAISGSTLIIVYVLFAIGSSICILARATLHATAGYKTATLLFNKMHLCIFRAPMSFFDATPSGRIINRVSTDQSAVESRIPYLIGALAFSVIQLLGIIAVMSQRYYISSARELSRLVGVCKASVIQHFSETISGATTIRSFDQQSRFQETNMKVTDAYSRPKFHIAGAREWLCFHLDMFSSVTFAFSLAFLVSFRSNIDPAIAGLAVTYGLNLNMLQASVIWNLCDCENRIISVERIIQYMSIPSEPPLVVEANRPGRSWPSHGEVDVNNLQVRYASQLPLVLRGITCTFPGGKKTGIVGRIGSGKSTLIQTLFRIVKPAAGQIMIDGLDISSIGLHDLRSRLSIIPQDPTMFEGTMRSNLDPLEEHTDELIWEALDKCQLGDEVRKKERKLDSTFNENGENWSMGQRQLVCLGRVLLKKSKVLVLDEATASVDTSTDNLIQQTLRQHFSDCIVITIAHRITSVLDSDMVLLLSHGLVMEYDSPTRLLENKSSSFAQLVAEYTIRSNAN